MVNERRDYLFDHAVFSAALARVDPDPSVMGWLAQARTLACWCELLGMDPLETCVEWSARGVNAGKGDRAMLVSALRDLDELDRLAAAGAFLRSSGVAADVAAGRIAVREPSEDELAARQAHLVALRERAAAAAEKLTEARIKATGRARMLLHRAKKPGNAALYWKAKERAAERLLPCPDDVKCSDWSTFLPVLGRVWWNESLLVPLYGVNESLRLECMSVEVICGRANPEAAGSLGEKRGLKNAPREGLFYPFDLSSVRSGNPLVICEGFMSGLALSLLMGGKLPVICAMSVGNFGATVQSLNKFVMGGHPFVLVPDIGGQDLAIDQAIPNARVIDLSAVPGAEGVDGYDPFDLLARHGVEMGRKYLRGLFREARDASL
ncbi:AAA family ATPase [Escherichia coli]|uniref:AAA family ATPase n=1 Tax=Escherichia coli TaxID=562 RepID=UPI002151A232|nr:AAA family ATPase [Escherichia coli]MCR6198541.1 AAA family ATPase [Escherichia coli]